jgi:UDPglucose--hexose-1-phosphate uridylyltransferase
MPEIRKDPVFGRWVIIASERRLRPNDFTGLAEPGNVNSCPFCPGHEKETPPSIYVLRRGRTSGAKGGRKILKRPGKNQSRASYGGWRLRVVRNKYPALVNLGRAAKISDGIYDHMDGIGLHEVVIETPFHDRQMEEMSVCEITDIVKTFILRVKAIKKDPKIKYVMIFKNFGRDAGASLAHPHSQIIAMPMTPIRVDQEIAGAEAYRAEKGRCVFCDILRQESVCGKRVVGENADFLAVTPYASRFSFETWILPKKHGSHFEDIPLALTGGLAEILKATILKLRAWMKNMSYNLIVHTMPVQAAPAAHYHWHIEIMPKLGRLAGFEWGTGFYINTVSPEDAAEIMNSGKKYRG